MVRTASHRFSWLPRDAQASELGNGTAVGCCTWARHCLSNSATSPADAKRSSGCFDNSRSMILHNHSGISGLISRIGLGASSVIRRRTP